MQVLQLASAGDYAALRDGAFTQAELDARDENGHTALMLAAMRGDYRVIEALKAHGANLDLVDASGNKAVHLAAIHKQAVAIAYLIEGGCGG